MSKVVIQVMSDWNDCEQCGGGSEDGGVIMIDNEVVFEHIPLASCYGNNSISDYDLLKLAFEKLGHTLDIEYVSVDEYEGDEDE